MSNRNLGHVVHIARKILDFHATPEFTAIFAHVMYGDFRSELHPLGISVAELKELAASWKALAASCSTRMNPE